MYFKGFWNGSVSDWLTTGGRIHEGDRLTPRNRQTDTLTDWLADQNQYVSGHLIHVTIWHKSTKWPLQRFILYMFLWVIDLFCFDWTVSVTVSCSKVKFWNCHNICWTFVQSPLISFPAHEVWNERAGITIFWLVRLYRVYKTICCHILIDCNEAILMISVKCR